MSAPKLSGITAAFLAEKYERQRLSVAEIANGAGCSRDLVYHYLKKYGIKKRSKIKDISGKRFHAFVVESLAGIENKRAVWVCRCDCGERFTATSSQIGLLKSCGCRANAKNITHRMAETRPYNIWRGMKTRCDNPNAINYARYGGRGIHYDDAWKKFVPFWKDMQEGYADGLTLDRIDSDGQYCKQNCRWITPKEQSMNTRSNHLVSCDGESKTVTEWAEELGVKRSTLFSQLVSANNESDVIKKLKPPLEGL